MRKIYYLIGFIILSFSFHLIKAETRLVPEEYPTIQSAITASSNFYNSSDGGDTIIVAPGIYVENIDFYDRYVFLTSHYLITEHDSSIHNTIIDGNQNSSVVTSQYNSGVLNGFTITNGSGRPFGYVGGGIFIDHSALSILNCIIKNNYSIGVGGGIFAEDYNGFMSNVIVTENRTDSNSGGGIFFINSNVEMDSINRCSVFLNEAGVNNDLYCSPNSEYCPNILLDTASVDYIDDYYIYGDFASVDILNGKIEKISNDLFVSPDGNNYNSGLTPDEPLKNITYALNIIDADSLNPRNIHLLPGVYSPSGGQHFPLNKRSYVSLIGSGKENTIIDLEQEKYKILYVPDYKKDITISSMTIKNGFDDLETGQESKMLTFRQNSNISLNNMLFVDNTSAHIVKYSGPIINTINQDETSITFQNCDFINNTVRIELYLSANKDILVQNCKFDSHLPIESTSWDVNINGEYKSIAISGYNSSNTLFCSRRIENCIFSRNMNNYNSGSVSVSVYSLNSPLYIINCTFTDNSSLHYLISLSAQEVHFINNILWNEDLPYEIIISPEMVSLNLVNNDIQNGMNDIHLNNNEIIIYEDSNIDTDPLFVDAENGDYTLQPDSPLIDAGTALYIVDGDTVINLLPNEYYGDAPDIGAYEFYPELGASKDFSLLPESIRINSVYPNPFNSSTTIKYQLAQPGEINLALYDLKGRFIKSFINAYVGFGEHNVAINLDYLASGTYILKLETISDIDSKKIVLLK